MAWQNLKVAVLAIVGGAVFCFLVKVDIDAENNFIKIGAPDYYHLWIAKEGK